MESSLIGLLVTILTVVVAFNLYLTLRLTAIVAASEFERLPLTLPVGQGLPDFTGRVFRDGRRLSRDDLLGQAVVLVFLSPGCSDCQARLPELIEILPATEHHGVPMWIIVTGSRRRLEAYLGDTPLKDRLLLLGATARRRLNPRNAAPFYIFADHDGVVLASNFIGDDDWLSFLDQMREDALNQEHHRDVP